MENTSSRAVVRASWQGGLPSVPSAVPRQLPAVVATFSGRLEELAQLDSALGSGAVVISAVNGTAGVGKTALALHWAHRVAGRFPDGQLYVNMRGFEPDREPMPVAEAVRGFLDALGVPNDAIPVSLDAQTALFRSKMAGRRVLLVLDNVNNAAQVRPLLPGDHSCFVLITSRNSLAGLVAEHGARPLHLDLLSDDEAADLLRERLGDVDTGALVELCSGLPLALSIVAARVALEPNTSIAELRAERLEALDLGEEHVNVRSVFSWSLRALSEPAARLFRLLGLHPGPDIDVHAAAALAGRGDCRKLLRELVSASLLDEYLPGRFRFHDLLRLFARELAGVDVAAQRQMLDFYLRTAWVGDRALGWQRLAIDLPALDPAVVPLGFSAPADARDWFVAEHAVLTNLVGHAAAAGFGEHAWRLALTMRSYLDTQGRWRDCESVYRVALEPVNRHGGPVARVRVHRGLGRTLSRLSRWGEAEQMLLLALDIAEESGDRRQQSQCHEALSVLCSAQGKHRRALQHANGSHSWHPREDATWLAWSWVLRARCFAALNLLDEALVAVGRGLELHRELASPDEAGEAEALNCAGHVHLRRKEFTAASEHARLALTSHRRFGNRLGMVEALSCIGDACWALGRQDDARRARDEAAAIQAELTDVSPAACS